MPRAYLNLDEVYETIHRPVVLEITKQMIRQAGFDRDKDLRVSFRGDLDVSKEALSISGNLNSGTDRYGSEEKLSINVVEKDVVGTNQHERSVRGQPLILLDPLTKTYAHCVYSEKEVEILFRYRSDSRNELESIRSNLSSMFSNRKEVIAHEINYDIQIPKMLVVIMTEIFKLRETYKPTNMEVGKYITNCFRVKPTIFSDLKGENKTLGYKEKQSNIQGNFDIQEIPKPEHVELGVQYTLEFSYVFRYSKPRSMFLKYPFVINSKILDKRFYDTEPKYDYIKINGERSSFTKQEDSFRFSPKAWHERRDGIVEPNYDDEPLLKTPRGYKLISRDLMLMEEGDRHVFNIKDVMSDYEVSDFVYQTLLSEKERSFKAYSSYFLFVVSSDESAMSETQFIMDDHGDVYSKDELDISKTYRIYFYILEDYSLLSRFDVDRICNKPDVTLGMLDMVDPTLNERKLLPRVIGNKKLVTAEFFNAVNEMNKKVELRWHPNKLPSNLRNHAHLIAWENNNG